MPPLVWDRVGKRTYETGIDRGVLYLSDGTAVPWNGLTGVVEEYDGSTTPVFFDGMKISDLQSFGTFKASLSAFTYPDEFVELEGSRYIKPGVLATGQPAKRFGLSYRTKVGDDVSGADSNYKIHLIYNVLATPTDKSYESMSDDPEAIEFEWEISAIPAEVPGMKPTAHFIIETKNIDPWLLEDLESALYGDSVASASLMPIEEMIEFMNEWYRLRIIDNEDGTWTADEARPGFITLFTSGPSVGTVEITDVVAVYLDADTFEISDTTHDVNNPVVVAELHGNGIWSATTDAADVISVVDGVATIENVDVIFPGPDFFRLPAN